MGVQSIVQIVECWQETPESVYLGVVPIHLGSNQEDWHGEETEGRG